MKRSRGQDFLLLLSAFLLFSFLVGVEASAAQPSDQAKKFEEYRTAIKKAHGIDIKQFKDGLKGGKADGKPIIKYDLQQLLMGIEVELEHTNNKMRALEISTDHLEEFPDYYTRLEKMEKEAEKEIAEKAKEGKK